MSLRSVLVLWPARVVDGVWFAYKVLLAGLSILALTTVALMLGAYLLGVRLFW